MVGGLPHVLCEIIREKNQKAEIRGRQQASGERRKREAEMVEV